MDVLFVNIPFIRHDESGQILTGPTAGSRWPWAAPGITDYAPYPFFMGYAANYLRMHGIDAELYDAVAEKHWDYAAVKETIAKYRPEVLFLETSTPLVQITIEFAKWAKESFGSRNVLVGPHVQAYAQELIREGFVDHCVVGEYEVPALDIALRREKGKPIYTFEHLDDINEVDGENFVPFRRLDVLHNYRDPSMNTPRPQLTVSTSRGCP